MNYEHSTSLTGIEDAAGFVPELESTIGTPFTPTPTRPTADFATSAAMAKDILALGAEAEGELAPPPTAPPPPTQPVAEHTGPRPVPDLDLIAATYAPDWSGSSPIAPDLFLTPSKGRRKLWKIVR
jgi:hypothetical protein